ncbi:DUF3341 domain-containing protein [Massilia agilis]|uniref:DUF3341 domain-containing protein n=1 Tax=Massilia agilis TaxID=1811226 RepID=A0ABT2DC14_9BURK|nr:DUF3341 domain-containing protein [Massilia agilis]MCS0808873.1 DUF3341 domain-containing protein [Massilia agilis]
MSAPYGLLAEFATADLLLAAVRRARENGCRQVEAYAPFAVDGLAEALGFRSHAVQAWTFAGAVAGGLGTYLLQWYSAVIDYPLNIGGRPLDSWPSFIPPTFELAVLGAAFAAVLSMLIANGLPRLVHPLFGAPEFDLASRNRFFLCLRASDPTYHVGRSRQMLDDLHPLLLREVAA